MIDPDAVLWSTPERERAGRPLLLLLHGFGSHEGDLFSLAPGLPLGPAVAALRAPLTLAPGAFAWFPLEATGVELDRAADEAARAVLDWLGSFEHGPVHVVGFSQGGAMALQLLRLDPSAVASASVLAGFLAGDAHEGDGRLEEVRPPVFWGRGTADDRIDDARVAALEAWLPVHSTARVRIYEDLGHAVSSGELRDLVDFLHSQL